MIAGQDAIQLVMDLRRQGVSDTRVLSAFERVPRAAFLAPPEGEPTRRPHRLVPDEATTRPFVSAVLLDALRVDGRHRVLQLPLGGGYPAALVSQLCRMVYAQDPDRDVRRDAARRLDALGFGNVVTRVAALADGWPEQAPFDRILLTEAVTDAPATLLDQLRPRGVLVAVLAPDLGTETVTRIERADNGFTREWLRTLPPAKAD